MKALKTLLKFILSIVFVVAIGLFAAQQHGAFEKDTQMEVPLFGMEGLSHTDLAQDVMLINLFASWCTPCEAEHPYLMTLAKEHKIPIYGIAVKDKPADMVNFLDTHGNPYKKVGMDYGGLMQAALGLEGMPGTLIVTRNRVIRWRHNGPITAIIVREEILPLIRAIEKSIMKADKPS